MQPLRRVSYEGVGAELKRDPIYLPASQAIVQTDFRLFQCLTSADIHRRRGSGRCSRKRRDFVVVVVGVDVYVGLLYELDTT
jgi:hypothetical protein